MKEALARNSEIILDEVNEDLFFPKSGKRWVRAFNRLLRDEYRKELLNQIIRRVKTFAPDVIIFYKGGPITVEDLSRLREFGCMLVCIYPDYSPHAYGERHQLAVGGYDLVISTKPFHPQSWHNVYGYSNPCHFVPQGYDPALHLNSSPAPSPRFDIGLVATYRKAYGELLSSLMEQLAEDGLTFGVGGHGWRAGASDSLIVGGELHGRSYIDWLRNAKICIAPLAPAIRVGAGAWHPGDVDTTRTYELAAAHCFFIHKRTDYVGEIYDEQREVPTYASAEELVDKIRYYLARPEERQRMAAAAHRRAVPHYSLDCRAQDIVDLLAANHSKNRQ